MANIDSQINDRMQMYAGNPQGLMQRYAQTQELVDLLALQKMKNDRAAATTAVQSAMQPPANTVKGQLQQEAMQGARNDILRSMAPGIQQQGIRTAQMRNRAAMGLPTQAAPNMARMAMGGIVGYQEGGDVESKGMQPPAVSTQNQRRAPYLDPALEKFLVDLEALNAQKDAAAPQEKDLFEQKIQDLINTTSPRVKRLASESSFGLPKKSGMAMGGQVKRYQDGGLAALESDMSRFGVEDSGLTPEEAQAMDRQQRDVGMVYGPFDFARDIRDIIEDLPSPQPIPKEALLRRDMIDATGSMTPTQVRQLQKNIERQISALPPEERMPSKTPSAEDAGITAGMYDVRNMMPEEELTMAQQLMKLPKVDREPRDREEGGLDIDFRALREFLTGGAGQTSTAGALASGAKRLGAFQTAEQGRLDKIQQAAAELQLKRDLAEKESQQLLTKLAAEYGQAMDQAEYKIAQDRIEALPLDPDYRQEVAELEDRFSRSPVELGRAKEQLVKKYLKAAVEAARSAVQGTGGGGSMLAGDAGIVG